MSGQSGAFIKGKFFQLNYTSGLNISVMPPPDEKNPDKYISEYFENESVPYKEKLKKLEPLISEYFDSLVYLEKYPIAEITDKAEWIHGVIIEDADGKKRDSRDEKQAKNRLSNSGKSAFVNCVIELEGSGEIIELTIAVEKQIHRSSIRQIENSIKKIFAENI